MVTRRDKGLPHRSPPPGRRDPRCSSRRRASRLPSAKSSEPRLRPAAFEVETRHRSHRRGVGRDQFPAILPLGHAKAFDLVRSGGARALRAVCYQLAHFFVDRLAVLGEPVLGWKVELARRLVDGFDRRSRLKLIRRLSEPSSRAEPQAETMKPTDSRATTPKRMPPILGARSSSSDSRPTVTPAGSSPSARN
jgi:hypothetical protein